MSAPTTVTPAEARALKHEGQARAGRRARPEDLQAVRAAVLAQPVGRPFSVNDLRAALDAADVPPSVRSSLLVRVAREGLAGRARFQDETTGRVWEFVEPSTGRSAKGSGVRGWVRLAPPAPGASS